MTRERIRIAALAFCASALLAAALPADAASAGGPAQTRAALRAQSLTTLTGDAPYPIPCVTPLLQTTRQDPSAAGAPSKRALAQLQVEPALPGERRFTGPDGTVVRCAFEPETFDRSSPEGAAEDASEAVEAVLLGIAEARKLLVDQLGLPSPAPFEIVLARLIPGVEGYLLPPARRDGRAVAVLDSAPSEGTAALRRAAAHQYAHGVALAAGPGLTPALGEALAAWVSLRVAGGPDARAASAISERLDRLPAGLVVDDPTLAAGNAAILAYLDEAHGPSVVGLAVQEIATGTAVPAALDRAMRRGTGAPFAAAFRDFQLWSHFVGARSDGRHFSFAERLVAPGFASRGDGLPSMSILSDPAVAPLGAASILLRPDRNDGGMVVRFEGDPAGRWEVDLLLFDAARRAHRLPVALESDGVGEATVPLELVSEAVLLVRNLDPDGGAPRRYSWSAFLDRGFPFEAGAVEAEALPEGGALVSWETLSERALVGFNVLRRAETARGWVRVNPLWVPPMGDRSTPASYRFLDATAPAGVRLLYRIEGVTTDGLSSFTDPFVADPSESR